MKREKIKKGFKRDPVCGMVIPEEDNAILFLKMHFSFCSSQCRERFQQNPYLYIGYGGHKAVKQEGIEVIKNRRIKLDKPITEEETKAVISAIQSMMGIEDVKVDGDHISLRYDLLQATEVQIEAVIEALGVKLGENWAERMRRAFVHFFEENECSAMSVRSGSGKSCH